MSMICTCTSCFCSEATRTSKHIVLVIYAAHSKDIVQL